MLSLQSGVWHRAIHLLASAMAKIRIPSFWGGVMESASLTNSPDDSNPVRNTGMKSTRILPVSLVALELSAGKLRH